MNENKHNHQQHGAPDRDSVPHEHRPYWVRAHRDWRFWGAVFLMLAAMTIYAMSYNLPWRPRAHVQQPLSGAVGK
ncbi:MAG: hypothetical protein ABSG32_00620 [Terriglobia bacterium]|jgi:hypothetical protein